MKETKDKYTVLNKLLHDEYLIVQINTNSAGVILPEHLRSSPSVGLKLSKMFAGGMQITKEKIEANLSFNKNYFCCILPLESIWCATSVKNEVYVWPESSPAEISAPEEHASPAKEKVVDKKPILKRVK